MKHVLLLIRRSLLRPKGFIRFLFSLLLMIGISSVVHAQVVVTGKVTDDTGAALPGVNVIVKSTTTGTTTDADGMYSISITDASEQTVLVYSFIGFDSQEQQLNGRTKIDVSMATNVQALSEVVVVGYGTQKKADVTGSIVSVGSRELKEVPVANLQLGLQGRAAGLEVQAVGTNPGAGAQIRIRGDRSILGNNNPLIVLDGIPFSDDGANLNDINPDDIASVEVLKDASATAIYGSRGSNGVILVTTKRGNKNGKTRLNVDSYYGISSIARKYAVYNAQEYQALRNTSPWSQGYQPEELASIASGKSTDWQDLIYQKGYITDNNVTLSGGGDNNQFSVGGGYFKQKGVLPGQDFARYTLKATTDFNIGKRVKIGMNTLNNLNITNGSQFVNPMYPILTLSPLMPAYNADGTIFKAPDGNVDDKVGTYNPLLLKNNNNNWVDKVRRLRTFNSLYGEVQIIEGLKYRANIGLDFSTQENDQFQGADSYFRPGRGNTANVNNSETWGYTAENLLNYEKTFAEKHSLKVTGLFSNQVSHTHNTYISKDSISSDFNQFYNLGASSPSAPVTISGGESTYGLVSYMARINYAYDNRYMITLTGRVDGSSRLAPGHKYHQYPAVSVGWNISNENFMQNINVVSNLKLRAGYGETSNQSVNPYASLGQVTNVIDNGSGAPNSLVPIKYNFGSQVVGGYYTSQVPNSALDWEYTRTLNIGIDFGILKNRITGAVEVYDAKVHNILYGLQLPSSSAVPGNFNENVGKIENKGVEVSISSNNISTSSGFTWNTDLNVFFNRNKLISLNDGFTNNIGNGLFLGQPLSAIYDYTKLGIWQLNEAAQAAQYGQIPGQLKIADKSGVGSDGKPNGVPDGKIDANDKSVIANQQATWQGGMTNRFAFKGFDFTFVMYARFGGTLISGVHEPLANYLTVNDGKRNGIKVDYWTPTNPTNWFPAPIATVTPPNAGDAWSTLGYYDASFVKMRSMTLGYTFNSSVLSRIKAQAIRLYIQAQNPFIIYSPYVTKYGGVDPEATGTGTNGFTSNNGAVPTRALTISNSAPPTRSFIVGINLTF